MVRITANLVCDHCGHIAVVPYASGSYGIPEGWVLNFNGKDYCNVCTEQMVRSLNEDA